MKRSPFKIAFTLVLLLLGFNFEVFGNRSDFPDEVYLEKDWLIQSSSLCRESGEEISSSEFIPKGWYKTELPSTVLATLVRNGVYENIFFSKNLEKIDRKLFEVPWWYRKEFYIKPGENFEHSELVFEGINFRADIWLNGVKIADHNEIFGAFRIFSLDISGKEKPGRNVLAVKVYPPRKGEFTIGFVDWNPSPPDNNMGLWRGVKLIRTGAISLRDVFVKSDLNVETLKEAKLEISGWIENHSGEVKQPVVVVKAREIPVEIKRKISLRPEERRKFVFSPEDFKELIVKNPRIWWPHNLGNPELYTVEVYVRVGKEISDHKRLRFGIRKIEDYFTPEGYRGYKINGKKFLVKGGGWVDDLLLREDEENLRAQIRYIKQMNLNTIRLEGFWGESQKLYDLADENGVLIMVGFSCHWEWEDYSGKPADEFGSVKAEKDMRLVAKYLEDQILWLRNHPSIFVWLLASDKLPRPALEKRYLKILRKYDGTRPFLAAAKEFTSSLTGPTGVKMRGPYAYVPPVYWYKDKYKGGAFGFNTETCPGAVVPPLESIKRMIPSDKLWPINEEWEYHCARREFQTLERYTTAINRRYGKPASLEEFLKKAQMLNYELIRPMFEAFSVNRYRTTGIIQWMINAAWPKMYWQLYDWYLMPTGAFFGAMHGNASVHLIYRYGFRDVWIVNETMEDLENLEVRMRVYNANSERIAENTMKISIGKNTSRMVFSHVPEPWTSNLYFLDLRLMKDGKEIDRNFYWLSKKMDEVNFSYKNEKTGWYYTPSLRYADLTEINEFSEVMLKVKTEKEPGKVKIILKNPSEKIAFFISLKLFDKNTGTIILPSFWSDNYVSLLPGETRVIKVEYPIKKVYDSDVIVRVEGWNVKTGKF